MRSRSRRWSPRSASAIGLVGLWLGLASCAGTTSSSTTTSNPSSASTTTSPGAKQVDLVVPPGNAGGTLSAPHRLTVPRGWTAEVWARVPNARMEAWTPGGGLLVSVPATGAVVELTPATGPSAPPAQRTVLSGLTLPQGLAFATVDGRKVLYVGESDRIDRYPWSSAGTPGARTIVVGNLPDDDPNGDDVHRQKDVAVGTDGTVYFEIGSSSNADPADRTSSPARATIMAVRPDGKDLRTMAIGVRNGEGLSIAPDGTLWTAVNERDQISYPTHGTYAGVPDAFGQILVPYVNEHPPDGVARITQGRDLGWPLCNPDQDRSTPTGSMSDVPLVNDAITNPDGTELKCRSLTPIEVGIAGHSAPLGFHFLEGTTMPTSLTDGAVLAVHGSWDRHPPRAPAVLWMPWNTATKSLEPAITLVGGFQDPDGTRWGRAVDAVPGPDGALYVSDDTAGAVYRLVPPMSAASAG